MQGKALTRGTPWKAIMTFAVPIMVGNILQQLYNTVDTIVVGNFDSQAALSAIGTTVFLVNLYLAIAQGFSTGAGVIVAKQFGANDEKGLKRSAYTSLFLMLGMGGGATIIGLMTSRSILTHIIHVPAPLLDMADAYFKIYAVGMVFQFGYNIIAALLRGVGDSKATLYFLVVSSILNVALDLLFVGGFHWSVAGAAIATTISQICACAVSLTYMWRKYPLFRFHHKGQRFEPAIARKVLRTGAPMALQQAIVSCGFMFIQRLVNSFGAAMTASFTVANRIENYLLVPAIALQNTLSTYTAQNLGAGRMDRINLGLRQTLLIACSITILLSIGGYVFAAQIITLFGIEGQAFAYCLQHIRFSAFAFVLFAAYFPCLGMFQGVGEGYFATVISSLVLASRIFFAYLLRLIPSIDYAAIWLCEPIAWIIAGTVNCAHLLSGKWREKGHVHASALTLPESQPDPSANR